LVGNLEQLQDEKTGLAGVGITSEQGWGVGRRYELAKSLRERTIDGPEAKRRWEEAILAIAKSEKYRDTVFPGGGLLRPQEGLLPLGADPQSGLWEFWHVQSGDEPERDKDGKFVRQKSGAHKLVERLDRGTRSAEHGTGVVLVLIPGGIFCMGAQATEPKDQNFYGWAHDDESPVHRVTLSPYFLSKYELTQGQWQRFTGSNPSSYKSGFNGTVGPTNPVEQVSWFDCERVLRRLGMELPSEARWEFACRGGTSNVWWTGSDRESLRDKINLADQTAKKNSATWSDINDWPDLDDGSAVHAGVGRYPANPFGLHEVHGNVWEWCFDAWEIYSSAEALDPLVDGDSVALRVYRGGSFADAAADARSASRISHAPSRQDHNLGVRPSRALRLSTSPPHNAR
jgi:formylglycine-generating enzyme required for sulfatase activity